MEQASQRYKPNFDSKPLTPFALAVETLQPGAGGRSIVKLLDGRAKRTLVLEWKAGRTNAPSWALRLLADKIRASVAPSLAVADHIESVPERPGLKAGAKNLARYLANKNR